MGRAARAARLLPGEGNLNLYRCVSGSVFTKEKQAQRTGLYLSFVSQTSCDLQAADPALRSTRRHCCLQTPSTLCHRRPGFPRSDPRVHLLGLPDPGSSGDLSGKSQRCGLAPWPGVLGRSRAPSAAALTRGVLAAKVPHAAGLSGPAPLLPRPTGEAEMPEGHQVLAANEHSVLQPDVTKCRGLGLMEETEGL